MTLSGTQAEEARRLVRKAATLWSDPDTASACLRRATLLAPDELDVFVSAYRFHFYANRFDEAAALALACIERTAYQLGIDPDWRAVGSQAVDFGDYDLPQHRFYLFALKAYGYIALRRGQIEEGKAALARAAALDPADRTGSAALLHVAERGGKDEDDD